MAAATFWSLVLWSPFHTPHSVWRAAFFNVFSEKARTFGARAGVCSLRIPLKYARLWRPLGRSGDETRIACPGRASGGERTAQTRSYRAVAPRIHGY